MSSIPAAPTADGGQLCDPPLAAWGELAERHRSDVRGTIGGMPRKDWRRLARRDFAAAAGVDLDPERTWIAAGHQPELFHPGVLLKSFAVDAAAKRWGAVGVHVRTDNDVATALRLAVAGPTGMVASVPLDAGSAELPWEERRADDLVFFLDFPERAAEFAGSLAETSVPGLWQGFRTRLLADPEVRLGTLFADGRQAVELAWGAKNVEAPLSKLCAGEAFRRFAADVLARPAEFAAEHNQALADYRRKHRLRSRHHPAADLTTAAGWTETPFWGWTAREPRRRPAQALAEGSRVKLRCGGMEAELGGDPAGGLAGLPFKLRPRALLTTAFLRLGLADFFVHGLGGGKYDALTDELLRRWWKLEPPAYAIVTGTLRLPDAPALPPLEAALRQGRRLARSLRWNPDAHLPDHLADSDALAPALGRKAELLEADPPPGPARRARWQGFRAVAELLRPFVSGELKTAEMEVAVAAERLAAARLRASREFAWCVHPQEPLRRFVRAFGR